MKKLFFIVLIVILSLQACSYGYSEQAEVLPSWDYFYVIFGINGYPQFNQALGRYDFFDLDDNYCGSVSFNPVLDDWECFAL